MSQKPSISRRLYLPAFRRVTKGHLPLLSPYYLPIISSPPHRGGAGGGLFFYLPTISLLSPYYLPTISLLSPPLPIEGEPEGGLPYYLLIISFCPSPWGGSSLYKILHAYFVILHLFRWVEPMPQPRKRKQHLPSNNLRVVLLVCRLSRRLNHPPLWQLHTHMPKPDAPYIRMRIHVTHKSITCLAFQPAFIRHHHPHIITFSQHLKDMMQRHVIHRQSVAALHNTILVILHPDVEQPHTCCILLHDSLVLTSSNAPKPFRPEVHRTFTCYRIMTSLHLLIISLLSPYYLPIISLLSPYYLPTISLLSPSVPPLGESDGACSK